MQARLQERMKAAKERTKQKQEERKKMHDEQRKSVSARHEASKTERTAVHGGDPPGAPIILKPPKLGPAVTQDENPPPGGDPPSSP